MAMWRPSGSGNLSNRRPMSSAAMNNNPQGVQQVMQPVAAPSMPNGNDAFQPMAAPSMPNGPSARASDLRQQTSDSKWRMAQSAATPLAPTPSNPFFKPQGRDPQNPSQFAVQSVAPGSGNFVDRGGQIQPRLDTSMARNVMAGQPAEGSPSFGQPMNIPGATQTLGGNVVSPPQRYGQEGVIPGANRGMTPFQGEAQGLSPDAFRVATGGQPMVPFTPSGTIVSPEASAASRLAARESKMARARGVRGSDFAEWRARRQAESTKQMNNEQQQVVADRNAAVDQWSSQGDMATQAPVSPVTQATQAPVSPVDQTASPSVAQSQQELMGQWWKGATNNRFTRFLSGSANSPVKQAPVNPFAQEPQRTQFSERGDAWRNLQQNGSWAMRMGAKQAPDLTSWLQPRKK